MSFIEWVIVIIIYSSLFLYYNHLYILIGFLILISLFFVFYKININKLEVIQFFKNKINKKPNRKKYSTKKMTHYFGLSRRPKILPVLVPLIITGLTAYIILNKLVFFAIITSGSMAPTLEVKDLVLMQNLKTDPQKGDIILFETEDAPIPVIHRIYSVSGDEIRTKGDAAELVDNWILKKDEIHGEALIFQGKPVVVKNIGEYLLFDPKKVQITQYGDAMYRTSQLIKNIKNLGLTIFLICIFFYIFLNFRSNGKSY